MPRKFWDEERIARLKKMVEEDHSFLDIARYFDCSRSAVAGACHRFGIKSNAPQARPQPRRPKQPIRAEDKALPRNQPAPAVAAPEPSVRIIAEDEKTITIAMDNPQWEDENGNPIPDDAVPSRGILLNELQPYSCRWPLNDGGPFRFCGCRKLSLKGPYCAKHEKRAGGGQPKIAWNSKGKSGLSMRNAVGRI